MNLFNNPDLDSRVRKIKSKIDSATSLNNIENVSENGIPIAKHLLDETIDDLNYIKSQVGENNENYIEVAEAIALAASGCVKFPISFLGILTQASDFRQDQNLVSDTKRKLNEATKLMAIITALPMKYESRQLVNQVNLMISNTESKVSGVITNTGSKASGAGGCYIATFAFDDYNSKEVLFLRHYRDDILNNTFFGRAFISLYYSVSPKLVRVLKRIPKSKSISQKIILSIIKILKK